MNIYLKGLIESISRLQDASGFESLMIVDDIVRQYDDHITTLKLVPTVKELQWYSNSMSAYASDNTLLKCCITMQLIVDSPKDCYTLTTSFNASKTVKKFYSIQEAKDEAQSIYNEYAKEFLK
jgi:hypothetical protein